MAVVICMMKCAFVAISLLLLISTTSGDEKSDITGKLMKTFRQNAAVAQTSIHQLLAQTYFQAIATTPTRLKDLGLQSMFNGSFPSDALLLTMNKTTLRDWDVLLKLSNINKNLTDFTPLQFGVTLSMLPATVLNLLKTVTDVATKKKEKPVDLFFMDLQSYGNWSNNDVNKLAAILKVPRSKYDQVKWLALDDIRDMMSLTSQTIAQKTIVGLMRALCGTGMRYNGSMCVKFAGCKSFSSLCISTARCMDIAGSYLCRCRAGYSGDGNRCSQEPQQNAFYYFGQLQTKFTDIAASRKRNIEVVLHSTWFELVGTTEQRLTELNVTAKLPRKPSPALVSLLTNNSITSLRRSHPLITSARPPSFNYTLLAYLIDATQRDLPEITASVLRQLQFPFGNASVASLLNVSAERIDKGNYLTDIYPLIKKNLPMLLAKTEAQFYEASFKTLSLNALKAMIGMKMFSELQEIRSALVYALVDMNSTAIALYSKMLPAKFSEATQRPLLMQKLQMTFPMLAARANISLHQLLSKTLFQIIGIPIAQLRSIGLLPPMFSNQFLNLINTTSITDIEKSYGIIHRAPALANKHYNVTLSTYLYTSVVYDSVNLTQISLKSILIATGGMPIASLLNTTDMALSKRHYLTDVYPLLKKMLPTLINKTAQHYYLFVHKMDLSEVRAFLGKNFTDLEMARSKLMHSIIELDSPGITVSAIGVLTTFLNIFKARVMALPNTPTDSNKAVVDGLVYLSTYAPLSMISKEFKLDNRLVEKGTLVSIANRISKVSKAKFAQIFKMDNQLFGLLNKAKIEDIDAVLKIDGGNTSVYLLTPIAISGILQKLPKSTSDLFETVGDIANATKTSLKDMTIAKIQQYGKWNESDVDKLLRALGVPREHFDSVRGLAMSSFSEAINSSLQEIAKFSVIQMNKVLCSKGKRYDGTKCVAFNGCKLSPSVCSQNARCTDIMGSYLCRCKAGFTGDGKNCSIVPLKNDLYYLQRMQTNFKVIAASRKISVEELLLGTWFELVGTTEKHLTALGLTAQLSVKPSPALISLLTNNSIASLRKSYPLITTARPQTFDFTLLEYLNDAITFDQPSTRYQASVLRRLPFGNASFASLLNISAEGINRRNYLTDIYPLIKKNLPMLLAKTAPQFYKASFKSLSLDALKAIVGMKMFSDLEKIRADYASVLLDMNSTAIVSYSRILPSKVLEMSAIVIKSYVVYTQKTQMTFRMLAARANTSLPQLLNKTWFEIIGTPLKLLRGMGLMPPIFSSEFLRIINTTSIADIDKSYGIIQKATALAKRQYNYTLGTYFYTAYFYDSPNATQISLKSILIATGGMPIASLLNTTNMALSKRHYLTDVYPLLKKMLPTLINKTAQHYYLFVHKMDLSEVRAFLGKNFTDLEMARSKLMHSTIELDSPGITVSAIGVLTTFLKIFKARVMALPNTPTDSNKAVLDGLVYLSTYAPIGMITKEFKLDNRLVEKGTLVSIANRISKVSNAKFAQIFKMDNQLFGLLNKAKIEDIDAVLKIDGGNTSVYLLTPIAISGILQKLPKSTSDLFETVGDIANATKTSLKDMTIAKIQQYGKWNESDVDKLLRALGVPREHFDSVRGLAMSSFSEAINSSLQEIAKFSVIQMNRVLCSKGKRYDGTKCVAFNGCKLSPSVCSQNARCTDIMGSYLCRCKAGFTGDGKNCSIVPLKNDLYYLQRMQTNFTVIAASRKISVEELLLGTWFELVGTTEKHLTALGLTAQLSVKPSPALISLLTNNSIASLRKSYPLITTARPQTFDFTLLEYLNDAITFDQPSTRYQASVLRRLPFGNASFASLLNISAEGINRRNYLTDIYPLIKKNLPMLLAKTAPQFYKASFKSLSLDALKAIVGMKMFSDLEKIRADYASVLLDMNSTAIVSYSRILPSKVLEMSAIVIKSYVVYTQKTQMTFRMLAARANTSLPQLLNKTWFEIIGTPLKLLRGMGLMPPIFSSEFLRIINTTSIADIDKSYGIIQKATALAKRQYNYTLGTYFYTAYFYDSPNATQISLKSILIATGGMPIASLLNTTNMALSKRHYLTDVYPLLKKMLPTLINKTAQHYYLFVHKMDLSEVRAFLGKNFTDLEMARSKLMHSTIELDSPGITVSAIGVLTTFLKIFKARVMALPNTPTDSNKAVLDGLVYLSTYAPIGMITKEFKLDNRLVEKGTLVSIANRISKVSNAKFAQIFKMDNQLFGLLNKAKIEDIDAVLKIDGGNTSVYLLTPIAISGILQKLPKSTSDLFETVGDIANATKTSLKDMTIAKIQQYGKWNESDVDKLLRALGVPREHFDSVRGLAMSSFSEAINSSLQEIAKFSVIQMNRVLCSKGKRYDGTKCVAFIGCKLSPYVCSSNARCNDIMGSYLCRCKAGFTGDGKNCSVVPQKNAPYYLQRMQTNFTVIAASRKISVEELLLGTWFELVGTTEKHLTALGLTAQLSVKPSPALISLLTNNSIASLRKSYPLITTARPQTFDFTLLEYLSDAITFDQPSTRYQASVLRHLPFGSASLASLLNVSAESINRRNYLTDIYPLIKKNLPMLLAKTAPQFYKASFKSLSLDALKEIVGMKMFSDLEKIRFDYARVLLDMNSTAIVSYSRILPSKLLEMSGVVIKSYLMYTQKTQMTFRMLAARANTTLPQLLNKTWFEIIGTPLKLLKGMGVMPLIFSSEFLHIMNTTSIADIDKSYVIIQKGTALAKRQYNYPVGTYFSTAYFYDSPNATQISLKSILIATGGMPIASLLNTTDLALSKRHYLTDVYPLLKKMLPTLINKTAQHYYLFVHKMDLSEVRAFLGKNFTDLEMARSKLMHSTIELDSPGITVSAIGVLTTFLKIFKARVMALPNTPTDSNKAVLDGLVYLSTYAPIGMITKEFKLDNRLVEKGTLVSIANRISKVSNAKFAQIFKMDNQLFGLLNKAKIEDIDAILKIDGGNTSVYLLTPIAISGILQKFPKSTSDLFETVGYIANATKTPLKDMTIAKIQQYGKWNESDVNKLLRVLKVDRNRFSQAKQLLLSTISKVINVSIWEISQFSVIQINRVLCSNGKRFDGTKCVMAFGCRMQSTCDANARCADLLGYFMCQCKAGFSGNGTSCIPDLPSKASISATLTTNFTAIATSKGMRIEGLLTKTLFEIVGANEQRLIKLGLLAFLPTQPSRALLSLLGNSTLLELQQAYPVLTNAPKLVGKNYDYSPKSFIMAAIELDQPSYYARVRKMLPFGNKSIANLLNTTDKAIENRNYLTDVYVNLKKSLLVILSKTTGDFIEEHFKNLSESTVREVVKVGFYSQLLDSRLKFASAVLDGNPAKEVLGLHFRNMLRQAGKVVADTRTKLRNNTAMTLVQSAAKRRIPVEQLLNMTWLQIIDTTPSIFLALGSMHPMPSKALFSLLQSNNIIKLEKVYGIIANGPVKLTGRNHNFTAADYLSNAVFFDDPKRTQAVFSKMPQVIANESLAGFMNMTKAALERRPYLTEVYPLLRNLIATILNRTEASYYETTFGIPLSSHDTNNFQSFMAGNFTRLNTLRVKMADTIIEMNDALEMTYYMDMQDTFLNTYRKRIKALPSTPSDNNMPVVKGLVYLSNKMKISHIKQIYNIGSSDLAKKTIIAFANSVSRVSSQKFALVFKLSAASMAVMTKANLKDIDVFLKLSKSATTLEQFTPVGLSNFLLASPIKNRRLLDTLQEISTQLKTAVKDLSPSQLQKYGSWSTKDVDTLTSTLGVSKTYYEEVKNMKLSTISTVIHTPETKLATFNVLDLLRALCSRGKRFDRNKCVAFAGCSSATCTPNARCINVIGSYYCRCKPGFAGNGTVCYDACKSKVCPAKAECNNVPGSGAVCKCSGVTQVLKNNACVDTKVTVFKVVELKFEEPYDKNYQNKTSQQYKAKAVELENALYIAVCSKIIGCVAIHVKDIREGSIVVDYDVVVDASVKNVTVSVVQNATIAALDDPALALFKPNKTSRPKAQTSDICQAGGHNCDKSAKCVPEGTSNYRCECNQGYEMKGGVCKHTEKEDNVLKIVLPIAIVAVVLIGVILFVLGRKRRRQRNSHDFDYEGKNSYKLNYNPYTQPELGLKNEKFENE